MKRSLIFVIAVMALLAAWALAPSLASATMHARVIGGTNAADSSYPWMANLLFSDSRDEFCGGSLIAPQWVLTAGHCVYDTKISAPDVVIEVRGEPTLATVDKIVLHQNYDDKRILNDIALLHLSAPSSVAPVALAAAGREIQNETGLIIGWGYIDGASQKLPAYLQQASVTLLSDSQCRTFEAYTDLTGGQLCVQVGANRADTCPGDSGGPLLVPDSINGFVQVGITSFGDDPCGTPGVPSVYTRVSAYRSWLNGIMTTGTVGSGDTIRPHVQAFRSRVNARSHAGLDYRVSDNSGFTHERLTVYVGSRKLARLETERAASDWKNIYELVWKAGKHRHRKNLRWCVTAYDDAGNSSKTSCAAIIGR